MMWIELWEAAIFLTATVFSQSLLEGFSALIKREVCQPQRTNTVQKAYTRNLIQKAGD